MNRPLKVFIDARAVDGDFGGVQQVMLGLASGFSRLTDADDSYHFLAYANASEWLTSYVGGPCRIVHDSDAPEVNGSWRRTVKRFVRRSSLVRDLWRRIPPVPPFRPADPPPSNGLIEGAGADIMHFASQNGFRTAVPSLYHPHDLQHIHLPQFFTARELWGRRRTYQILADQARLVPVASSWTREDVVRHLHLAPDKVAVVELAPPLNAYEAPSDAEVKALRERLRLHDPFAFYPAQTWPHKNHLQLLDALAQLRDREGLRIPLVCSGTKNAFYAEIAAKIRQLRLTDQTQFVGFVSTSELQCLYRMARVVVIPTLFEAASGPIWDAFLAGTAVACSNVTSLPRQVGDAAELFDPHDPVAIGAAIRRLWLDREVRRTLITRGSARVARFTWEHTARVFRAHYRRIAHRQLTAEDLDLLGRPPLL